MSCNYLSRDEYCRYHKVRGYPAEILALNTKEKYLGKKYYIVKVNLDTGAEFDWILLHLVSKLGFQQKPLENPFVAIVLNNDTMAFQHVATV